MGQTPPPYYGDAPKKSNSTTIIFIVLGVCAACCVLGALGVGGLGWFAFTKGKSFVGCAMGFEEARQATLAYAEAHDGKLPNAATWQDDIRPYFAKVAAKNSEEREMLGGFPPEGEWSCQNTDGPSTGIAFNKALSGKKVADVINKGDTILFFETSKVGANLSDTYEERSDADSPKLMGQPRGWLKLPLEGKAKIKGNKPININAG